MDDWAAAEEEKRSKPTPWWVTDALTPIPPRCVGPIVKMTIFLSLILAPDRFTPSLMIYSHWQCYAKVISYQGNYVRKAH